LTSQIPDLKLEVLIGDLLNVEADGRNGSHNLTNLIIKYSVKKIQQNDHNEKAIFGVLTQNLNEDNA